MSQFLPDRPRRRFFFMLTPLVDVMFLLLIFFMLSSQTSPYSLLTIAALRAPAAPAAAPPEKTAATRELIVSIARDYVRLDGVRVGLAGLPQAIEKFRLAGFSSAALLTTQSADVQDLVSVLEIFEASQFGQVRLVSQTEATR